MPLRRKPRSSRHISGDTFDAVVCEDHDARPEKSGRASSLSWAWKEDFEPLMNTYER